MSSRIAAAARVERSRHDRFTPMKRKYPAVIGSVRKWCRCVPTAEDALRILPQARADHAAQPIQRGGFRFFGPPTEPAPRRIVKLSRLTVCSASLARKTKTPQDRSRGLLRVVNECAGIATVATDCLRRCQIPHQ
jgi:hypothetical protein